MMRVLKPLQDRATTGAGKRLVLPEPRRVRFLIRGEGPVSAGAVTIECCPESTKAGKFWIELATIPVPSIMVWRNITLRKPPAFIGPVFRGL